ncbi:tetratricopeptide repeat protein [Polynucleobacter wuianus]|uniref:tetratricopeptide repeat protein n=1 Tax=Polynucleobacter wuianus TaxID=1743168 RepID=UPI001C0BD481|nr:glycosyltransferase family 41 protein [Polynucleobacter wuianus]MBU3610048.1 tetratricopeptide repeat protein [Polynucleobacter wuianus]
MNKPNPPSKIDNLIAQGLSFQRCGQFEQAKLIYEQILSTNDRHYDALHYLGILLAQQGQLAKGELLLRKAISVNGQDEKAYNNLGLVLQGLNNELEALAAYDQAIAINGSGVEAHYNRACLLQNMGQLQAAIEGFDDALLLRPDHVEALNNRGNAQDEIHLYEEAIKSYRRALQLRPGYAECLYNLGLTLGKVDRVAEALECCQKALALQPLDPEILNVIGYMQMLLDQDVQALSSFEKSISLFNHSPQVYFNYAYLLHKLQKYEAAIAAYNRAIELKPDYADAIFNRGNTHHRVGNYSLSIADYKRALELDPEDARAKWALTISAIPPVIHSIGEQDDSRKNFRESLTALDAWFNIAREGEGHKVVGSRQPFYLAYQDQNNKQLLEQYGDICIRLMSVWQKKNTQKIVDRVPNEKMHIGIVTNHIHDHSVWNAIVKGWVSELNMDQFEVSIFYLGNVFDEETAFARSKVKGFINTKQPLLAWMKTILDSNIDALIYPEIGMHTETLQLASMRLAPLQIASWGHPETTGLKTIDCYLSAELMETENAQNYYVEKVVRLPNLGCYYFPLDIKPVDIDLSALGLDVKKLILLCPGTPYKYIEKYDDVYVEIAKSLKNCQLVFFTAAHWASFGLEARLRKKFEAENISFEDHIKFIPWLSRGEFFGLMSKATMYLDTIGFSGFNTAMQAIECNLPIVTMKTPYLRGNLATAPLSLMKIFDLVVNNEQEYLNQVIKLATDKKYLQQIKSQIEERKHILFKDKSVIQKLEQFLLEWRSKNLL